ncbi:cytochrome P450 6k1-like [Zootermopsis nevadensis]|nr:cytochrome P450 6k1-like [Zootermopsis nevadensis]
MEILVVFGAILAWLYYYFTANFNYWKNKGVPYLKPVPFFGNLIEIGLHRKTQAEGFRELYRKLEGQMFGGIFQTRIPMIMFRDPDLIKHVLIKDFSHFHDRGMPHDVENDPISANLVILEGQPWKNLRLTLNPAFNSSKMRILFHLVKECAEELSRYLDSFAQKGDDVDLRDVLARYATDNISSCAFGVKSNSLKNPHSKFREMGEKIIAPGSWTNMHRLFRYTAPSLLKYFNIKSFSDEITDFFVDVVKETLDYRENNKIERKDFLNLLIQLKKKVDITENDDEEDKNAEDDLEKMNNAYNFSFEEHDEVTNKKFTKNGAVVMQNGQTPTENGQATPRKKWLDSVVFDEHMIAAQVCVFFLGGFETAATSMSFCLYELSLNQDVQRRLRDEIDHVLKEHNGNFTYNALEQMEYLDHVVAETLRMYPSLPNLIRVCTKPYTIPGTNVLIDKGTPVIIPIYAIHRDPLYYYDPDRFDPERFTDYNKEKRPAYTYLPFGEGPRICIGLRFGLMQVKMGLAILVSRFQFDICEKSQVPLIMDPKKFVMNTIGGLWLKVTPRAH